MYREDGSPHAISPAPDTRIGLRVRGVFAFVVKYNATAGKRELRQHRDGAVFSFNVALNGLGGYEGGGTSFPLLGAQAYGPAGHQVTKGSPAGAQLRAAAWRPPHRRGHAVHPGVVLALKA